MRQARAEADQRVAAAGAERDAAIAQARADAGQRVRAAEARSGTRPARRQPPPRTLPGRPGRRPRVRRPPPALPRQKPGGSAPTPSKMLDQVRRRGRPANAMSCAPTCAPAPSAPSSRLTPTATNWTGSAPPATTPAPQTAAAQRRVKTTRRAARTPAT